MQDSHSSNGCRSISYPPSRVFLTISTNCRASDSMRARSRLARALGSTSEVPRPGQQRRPEVVGRRLEIHAAGRHQADLRQRTARAFK